MSDMSKLRVFVSFEFDKDNQLKGSFVSQAKEYSPHRVVSFSKSHAEQEWQGKARSAIQECEIVIVLVGQDTHNAPGVKTEVKIARRLKKPIFQVVPQEATYTGLPGLDEPIRWKWKNINKKIDELGAQK